VRLLLGLGFLPAVALLAAFSPPLPSPEGVQQAAPKSWIPEPKEKAPPFEYHAWEWGSQPTLPDTCANGYVAPPRPPDLVAPPGIQVITPEEMFERACKTKPPDPPDRQLVECAGRSLPGMMEIARIEIAKPLSDAYWFIGKSVYADALAAIERAQAAADKPEEKLAVALARAKHARGR